MSAASEHDAIHEEVHGRLGAYFDGELAADDERAVLEHLPDCERCQAALDDLMGLHVALGRPTPVATSASAPASPARSPAPRAADVETPVIPLAARRSKRGVAFGGMALAAAAAAAVVVWAPWQKPGADDRVALGDTRPVEVRFSADAFAQHRQYRVDRGGPAAPSVPLATLSALERRGDRAALAAALAWSGDRARAGSVLDEMPDTAEVFADRAALALLLGRPEDALEAADQALITDASLAAARWNRALALRDLQLPLAAAVELERLAAADQPGWAAEAAERAKALRDELTRRRAALADATSRRRAALAGGPPLTEADLAIAPNEVRAYFHEALRVASTPAELDRLNSLAATLDRTSGGDYATNELARVRATDLTVRARFADRYRAIAAAKPVPAVIATLLADLKAAGPALDDLRLGVILAGGQVRERLDEVEGLVAGLDYPLFQLLPVQERFAQGRPRPSDHVLARRLCDNASWALRCGQIDHWDAGLHLAVGQWAGAERLAARAVARLSAGGAPKLEDNARVQLGEVLRLRARIALGVATAIEVGERASATDCAARRSVHNGLAELERRRGAAARARAYLAHPEACPAGVDPMGLAAAVDLARDTGEASDRELAMQWLTAARTAGLPGLLVDVADARLRFDLRPIEARDVLMRASTQAIDDDVSRAVADWASRTLIAADGARGDWHAVFEHTLRALGQTGPVTCAIALATDDTIHTAAWRDATGRNGGAQWREPARWPALPPTALQGCTSTAVVALSPLHGRPPPWSLGTWAWSSGRAAPPPTTSAPRPLVVAATTPPPELLDLPTLAPVPIPTGSRGLSGADATPARVAAALTDATYVELHAHGLVDLDTDDGGFIALSPDASGDWRMTASDVRGLKLAGAPVVVLAACHAAEATPHALRRWSLPDAFLAAGARAVIAADVAVPDDLIRAFVDDVRGRLERGEAPAVAAAAARAALVARDPASASWVERLMVFE